MCLLKLKTPLCTRIRESHENLREIYPVQHFLEWCCSAVTVMRNVFPSRRVRKIVLYKVTPIDLPVMDLIFIPHLLCSLTHITAISSCVTHRHGEYSTWEIGIFIWEETIGWQSAVDMLELSHYVFTHDEHSWFPLHVLLIYWNWVDLHNRWPSPQLIKYSVQHY